MWVCSSGWNEEVMATPREKSRCGSTVSRLAPTMASEFDRVWANAK
jgi:hypothetical protein